MKVKSEREVAQLCLTLSDPMDYSLPGSSIHGIFQARVLEWGAIAFSGYIQVLNYNSIHLKCIYIFLKAEKFYHPQIYNIKNVKDISLDRI